MGKLIYSESGHALMHCHEELSSWRWARKSFRVPAAAAGTRADLLICLLQYGGNRHALRVDLNGEKLAAIKPDRVPREEWLWLSVPIGAGRLKSGVNTVVLRSDNRAMDAWMLAIEPAGAPGRSSISFDKGGQWRRDAMGAHGALAGEYLVRLYSHAPALRPEKTPRIVYEDAAHPRVRELLSVIPESIRRERDGWKQTLALRSFICASWAHDSRGVAYAPWDPLTILSWAGRGGGHGRKTKITMCVHFGVTMASMAAALGMKARPVVVTEAINGPHGHFMAEVWDEGLGKWVLHDANCDSHIERDGVPLSAFEIADLAMAGVDTSEMVRCGPSTPTGPAPLIAMVREKFWSGKSFRHAGLWVRSDYVSDPSAYPPNHGSIVYTETGIVWYDPKGSAELKMFPHRHGDRGYFDAR